MRSAHLVSIGLHKVYWKAGAPPFEQMALPATELDSDDDTLPNGNTMVAKGLWTEAGNSTWSQVLFRVGPEEKVSQGEEGGRGNLCASVRGGGCGAWTAGGH